MNGSYSIDFRWPDRQESSAQCARRANEFLRAIAPLSAGLAHFRPAGRKNSTSLRSMQSLFEAGVNRRDLDRSAIEDLGFSASLVNADSSAWLRMHCGVYCGVVPNTVSLELTASTDHIASLLTVSRLRRLFQAAVRAWEPERGRLLSMELFEAVPQSKKGPNFGWLTYLAKSYEIPNAVRKRFHVEDIDGQGNRIATTGDDNDVDYLQDFTRVKEIVSSFPVE